MVYDQTMQIRLQKYLADHGIASRRHSEILITEGRVTVNDQLVDQLGAKVSPTDDQIKVDGKLIVKKPATLVIALHKPLGYVSTTGTFKNERNVLTLIPHRARLYPVGRLDKNSSGLLLLTNNGELAYRLTHPKFQQEKEYLITTDQPLSKAEQARLIKGVKLTEGTATIKTLLPQDNGYLVILTEGKKRQIRRMVESLGKKVLTLKRTRVKNLKLGQLKPGEWRELNEQEIQNL